MKEEHIDEPTKSGQYLAYEREKKDFTVEDIARELHLSANVVRALEEDAYDKLPELVYVRGYIRSYCRILGIDPIPVLDMYTTNLPKEEDYILEDLSLSSPVNENQQRLIMIWGSIAVVAIFLILIIGWWQENRLATITANKPMVSQDESVEQSDIKDANISNTAVEQEIISPEIEIETVPVDYVPSVTEQEREPSEVEGSSVDFVPPAAEQEREPSEVEGSPVDFVPSMTGQAREASEVEDSPVEPVSPLILNPIETEVKAADEEDATSDELPGAESATINDVDSDITADVEPDNRPADEIVDMPQPVTLVVMSKGESWARVRDGKGEIIIHRILTADYNKIFMVNLPLKFELGNAYHVSIMVDGKDYDFSSYIKPSRTATFEVIELP